MAEHTEQFETNLYDYCEHTTERIWSDLQCCSSIQDWKNSFPQIVFKYRVSLRFACIRVLCSSYTGSPIDCIPIDGFTANGHCFENLTLEHANSLTDDEVADYIFAFKKLVLDFDPDMIRDATVLIEKAMKKVPSSITVNEVIKLGHYAGFTLESMQFLLLRAFDDNGLSFSEGLDIIDIWGFLTRQRTATILEIKTWYRQSIAESRVEDAVVAKAPDDTRRLASIILRKAKEWGTDDIKTFLKEHKQLLDQQHVTASIVYQDVAAMLARALFQLKNAMNLEDKGQPRLEGEEHLEDIVWPYLENLNTKGFEGLKERPFEALIKNGTSCKAISNAILHFMHEKSNGIGDRMRSFRQLHVENNEVTANGSLNSSRQRMVLILSEKIYPRKGDLLMLVWAYMHIYFDVLDDDSRLEYLWHFIETAELTLNNALLPTFYPIALLERAMISAIVEAEDEDPAIVYDQICSSFDRQGEDRYRKHEGDNKFSLSERKTVVNWYKEHKASEKATLKDTAALFGCSVASIKIWKKQFEEQEKLVLKKK